MLTRVLLLPHCIGSNMSLIVALNPLGAGVMSLVSGYLVDSLGRRLTMVLSNFIVALGCILVLLAHS